MLPGSLNRRESEDEFGIRLLAATFRDQRLEADFLEARRLDDVRSVAIALLMGGMAYAAAGVTDAAVFTPRAEDVLPVVHGARAIGVVLLLSGAAAVYRLKAIWANRLLATVGMLGTLLTYSVIAYLEETRIGPSDLRLVFSVFALLAFIFFPLPVLQSALMAAWMMLNVVVLFLLAKLGMGPPLLRELALMFTFAVAGASFSITTNRARRKEFLLRRRHEEAMQDLSREVEQRRAIELELQRHKESLEATVEARTDELRKTERQVMAAQRMEAIGQLAGGLAHDFNNLLSVVMGNADMTLELGNLPAPARELQRDILEAAGRASALSRDLLTFARRDVISLSVLDLRELVDKMTGILRTAVGARADFTVSVSANTPRVKGAAGPLEQMILNLVINARDALGSAGRISIEVTAEEVESAGASGSPAPGPYAKISVADDGAGIAPAYVDRIFEPFFTTKTDGAGTGLGLSVVHGIVRQHGGTITVWSEPGRGARFDVYLPAMLAEATAQTPKSIAPSRGGQERILVVDDEELVLKVALAALRRAGYDVQAAPSAARALELLHEPAQKIDLVVTDLMMPLMNGRQLMERCREQGLELPFLFVSGYSDGGIHRDFVLERGISLLKKPYRPSELVSAVRGVLDRLVQGPR